MNQGYSSWIHRGRTWASALLRSPCGRDQDGLRVIALLAVVRVKRSRIDQEGQGRRVALVGNAGLNVMEYAGHSLPCRPGLASRDERAPES
jgi:hypothetical protein